MKAPAEWPSGKVRIQPKPHGVVVLALLCGCSLFEPAYQERAVAGPTEIGTSTTVRFSKSMEPRHRAFEVCLKLAPRYGIAPSRMDIMNPDGTFTRVRAALEAEGASVVFDERLFRHGEGRTLACFYEQGAGYEVPRRRYLSVTFQSDRPLPVEAVVLADYDPK